MNCITQIGGLVYFFEKKNNQESFVNLATVSILCQYTSLWSSPNCVQKKGCDSDITRAYHILSL